MWGVLTLTDLQEEDIVTITRISDQSEINISKNWITGNYQDVVFISLGDRPELQDVVEPVKICLKACRNSSTISRNRT